MSEKRTISLPEEDVTNVLECPVCLNIPRSKCGTTIVWVFQCQNGHTVCDDCFPKLTPKVCPSCRIKMVKTRSLIAEQVLARYV